MNQSVAIVTGAASGIGRAIARALAQRGDRVVVADIDTKSGQAAADETGARFIYADLSLREDCQQLVTETLARYRRIDILVNNAGFQHVESVDTFPPEIWDKMIAVMLTAPFLLTQNVWQTMKSNGWGRIINISSIHGRVASPFKCAYVTAKHGLIGFTRSAALEGGAHGITVNAICPGYVRTPLVEQQIADQARTNQLTHDEVLEQVMLAPAAIKKLIRPEEIASLVVYLCSEEAGVVTGADWAVDLGWTAR
ncbi:MAG: 3-hydroxybutyrate dehydrogenase [Candidatus Poribacteria bacterium]|nr:3-hydroxybutyrate dehydrogenase [Candidatus Poribacteria bacterium]